MIIEDIFQFFIQYGPTLIYTTIDILVLVLAIFIYKNNSSNYSIFFALYSIIRIVSNVIYMAIDYVNLVYKLDVIMGMDVITISLIMLTWGTIFMVLGILSSIFLIIAVFMIYQTHKSPRNV